jgi:hypothetical protein
VNQQVTYKSRETKLKKEQTLRGSFLKGTVKGADEKTQAYGKKRNTEEM